MPAPSGLAEAPVMAYEDAGKVHSELDLAPVSKAPSKRIQVVALQKGFLGNNQRIEKDEIFTVKDMSQLAFWMKCTDPTLEKEHQRMVQEKKLAERNAGK